MASVAVNGVKLEVHESGTGRDALGVSCNRNSSPRRWSAGHIPHQTHPAEWVAVVREFAAAAEQR
jgi:hypothetical protein